MQRFKTKDNFEKKIIKCCMLSIFKFMKLCSNPNSRVKLLLGNYSSPTNYISGYYISSAALNDNSVSPLYAGKGNKKISAKC